MATVMDANWSNELAAQIDIFTPFGGLFVAMYTINHGPIKFQITHQKKEIKSPYFISRYYRILQQTISSHPQSPLFTLLPPLIGKKTDPSKLNETHIHLIFFYLHL